MARFWFPNAHNAEQVEALLRAVLANVESGGWVSPEQMCKWHCNFSDQRFGDAIFLMQPGWLITPSYMGLNAIPGMHGYDPAHKDSKAFLISNRQIPEHVRSITDLRSIMTREVIERPASSRKKLEVIFR